MENKEIWCKSKIDLINKYASKIEVGSGRNKTVLVQYYCRRGDKLKVITRDANINSIVIACEFKGQKFSIKWDEVEILNH